MRFNRVLFVLSSFTVLVTANVFGSRQATAKLECPPQQKLQCCELNDLATSDAQEALASAGISPVGLVDLVGSNCKAATATNDPDKACDSGGDIACCPTTQPSSTVNVNCTLLHD